MYFHVCPSGPVTQTIAAGQPVGFRLFQVNVIARPEASAIFAAFPLEYVYESIACPGVAVVDR
jgi:hypothetical protein